MGISIAIRLMWSANFQVWSLPVSLQQRCLWTSGLTSGTSKQVVVLFATSHERSLRWNYFQFWEVCTIRVDDRRVRLSQNLQCIQCTIDILPAKRVFGHSTGLTSTYFVFFSISATVKNRSKYGIIFLGRSHTFLPDGVGRGLSMSSNLKRNDR